MNSWKSCLTSSRSLLFALAPAAFMLTSPAAFAADAGTGCVQNRGVDTAHYVDALKGDARNLSAAIFQQIPSDLTMATESAAYRVQSDTAKRALPMESAPSLGGLATGERVVASCRVKGPAGDWWLAVKSDAGSLIYVAESKAQKLTEGGAGEVKPEAHPKDPNAKY